MINQNGIKPSPNLVQGIHDFPTPDNKSDAQRLLGFINYFGKYIPNVSSKTNLLRDIIKDRTVFEWTGAHQTEWEGLKTLLVTAPTLALFDPEKPVRVSTDASQCGLGAALMQLHETGWRPVAYASRALSDTETRYSQIEKKTLGVTYRLERFHDFVYGRKVLVETDHKPLIAIAKKSVGDMPPRLQRFFLRLMKYDFELKFIPGKDLVLPDALSRAFSKSKMEEQSESDVELHAVGV